MTTNTRAELRTEIEFTREKFARFLVTISDEALQRPSKNPAWTNGELLYLMSVGPRLIQSILRKYMHENPSPNYISKDHTGPLIQKTSELLARERGHSFSRWMIAAEYDTTCTLVLELLDMFSADDFEKTLVIPGKHPVLSGEVTIGELFHYVRIILLLIANQSALATNFGRLNMTTHEIYAVIGAGHGGKAMAAHLALMGVQVNLYNRTFEHIEVIQKRGGIELEALDRVPCGLGKLKLVTSNLGEALKDAQVVMVVLPSSAHLDIAKASAPYLKSAQIVILHPGRTCGALEFVKVLRDEGCTADVTIAEAETFIYASRSEGPAQARIFRVKEAVPLAALPATRTEQVLESIRCVYPQFIDGVDVLHTGLNNMGAIFHPALTLLNSGWIEATHGDYQFYIDGVTPSVARVLEVLDRERVTVASSLGIRARTSLEWLKLAYNTDGQDLHEAIHNQPGYYGIKAPATLQHRYIFEDVPMSLVPIASLGKRYGVSVRGMESIINLGGIIHRTDYWRRGRTVECLGLEQWSVSELTRYVQEGVVN